MHRPGKNATEMENWTWTGPGNEKTMLELFEKIHLRCGNQTNYLNFSPIDSDYGNLVNKA